MMQPQYRLLKADITRAEGENKDFDIRVSFSSEAPVLTYLWEQGEWAYEILDHGPGAAQLERINANGMFIFCHERTKPLGRVVNAEIGADRKGYAAIRFLQNSLAKDYRADIESGDMSGVSFGYYAWDYVLEHDPGQGGYKTYRARKWDVLEVSTETIPADIEVGGERTISTRTTYPDGQNPPGLRPNYNQAARAAANEGGQQMADNQAAGMTAEEVKALNERINKLETESKNSAENHARTLKILGKARAENVMELGARAVEENWDYEKFNDALIEEVKKRNGNPIDTTVENFLNLGENDKKRFSMIKLINSLRSGRKEDAALEWEMSDQIGKRWNKEPDRIKVTRAAFIPFDIQTRTLPKQQRDLTAGSQTGGGYLIQNQYGSIIELLRANAEVSKHVTYLPGLVGDYKIARQTGAGQAYWIGEGNDPTESTQSFGMIKMTPKKLGSYTDITDEQLSQSSVDSEQLVIMDLTKVMGLKLDSGIINGLGANGEPLGILNTSGIGSVSTSGGITHAESVEFLTDIVNSNYPANNCRYITNGTIMGTAMTTLKDSVAGAGYIWEGGLENGRINGMPAHYSTNMPANTMIFGDFSQVLVGKWGDLQIGVDLAANFLSGGVRVRLLDKCDIALRHVGAISAATDI